MLTVAVSGGFDPLHVGHIEYIKLAKELAGKDGKVVCILNSDKFLMNKKGFIFMNFQERKQIMESIKYIDRVVECIDADQTVCKTLEILKPDIFAKGGDRGYFNSPEVEVCLRLGIHFVDGLGDKIQSSSKLVERNKNNV